MGGAPKGAGGEPQAQSPVVVLDANNICHIALHSMGELSFHDKKTGVIFGFFVRLLKLWEEFRTTNFIFCWDSRKRFRSAVYPEYKKGNRLSSITPEERVIISTQMEALRCEVLPAFGFKNILHQTGYEADDLIATVTSTCVQDIIVVSTDKDLFQLLEFPGFRFILNPVTKKKMNAKLFWEQYGIEPSDWVLVKAAMGDPSDNIPGIPGIGEKSALAWVKGELGGKKLEALNGGQYKEEFKRNFRLVSLPFLQPGHPIKIPSMVPNELDFGKLVDIFDYNGFQSFLREDKLAKWKEFVNAQEEG